MSNAIATNAYRANEITIDTNVSDLGAAINAADATIGANSGTIIVPNGNYAISSQVVLGAGHVLKLGAGAYTPSIDKEIFLLKDNTTVIGAGWETVIFESSNSPSNQGVFVFRAYNDSLDGTTAQHNVTVRDLQIAPGTGVMGDGAKSAIAFGNMQNGLIENVYFNTTHAIGAELGGSSSTGLFANNCTIRNCLFYRVWAVSAAAVNAIDFQIVNNRFIGSQTGSTTAYIDLEINTGTDTLKNFVISGNVLDSSGIGGVGGGTRYGINAYAANANPGPGVIANNTLLGGAPGGPTTAYGIQLGMEDVLITGNFIKYYDDAGILLLAGSAHNVVSNNILKYVGFPAIDIQGTHNQILNNIIDGSEIDSHLDSYCPYIQEVGGTGDFNVYTGNVLNSYYNPFGGGAWQQAAVQLVGANSVSFNNIIDGLGITGRGGIAVFPTLIAANYTILLTDQIVLGNTASVALTITLPTAVSSVFPAAPTLGNGRILTIKNTGNAGHNITVNTVSSQTIDGAATFSLLPLKALTLVSDGSNWQSI